MLVFLSGSQALGINQAPSPSIGTNQAPRPSIDINQPPSPTIDINQPPSSQDVMGGNAIVVIGDDDEQ
jgi:hypothetical protein